MFEIYTDLLMPEHQISNMKNHLLHSLKIYNKSSFDIGLSSNDAIESDRHVVKLSKTS